MYRTKWREFMNFEKNPDNFIIALYGFGLAIGLPIMACLAILFEYTAQ